MSDIYQRTRVLDANARWHGIEISDLMENAGKGIAKELIKKFGKDKNYSFICGLGNNGGDGLAAARFLAKEIRGSVTAYLFGRESEIKSEPAKEKFRLLKETESKFKNLKVIQDAYAKDIENSDVIIECLLGTGIKGKLYKRFSDVIKKISRAKAKKIAIDIPVPGYKYDLAISLHFPKVKDAVIVDIGIPTEVEQNTGPGQIKELYVPGKDSYKSQNGELFVFGGSNRFHGAPMMAIMSASKFIGSVYFYTVPENRELLKTLKSKVCEFITVMDDEVEKYAGYADALLIGPGLEDNFQNRSIINRLFELYPDKPKIIDAYAIAMAPKDKLQNCILTPHRGELRHIWGDETIQNTKRLEGNLRRFSKESGAIVVLKGHVDLLFHPSGEVMFNKTGNPGMAKGGTGDCLSGVTSAFATKNDLWLAAQSGVFINGLAGDLAAKEFGYNYSATDIIPFMQKATKYCREF